MLITLNQNQFWNLNIKKNSFFTVVDIIFDPNAPVDPNPSEVKITFEKCDFQMGVDIQINIESYLFTKIEIVFIDCFIRNSDTIRIKKDDHQIVELTFLKCVLTDFEIDASALTSITLSRTLFAGGRFWLNDSKVNFINFSNCLGDFFVNDNGFSKINVSYTHSNLFIEPFALLNKIYKAYVQAENLKNILGWKTKFYLSNAKVIDVRFDALSDKHGIQKELYPSKRGVMRKDIKYYPTPIDIENLNISLQIDQDQSVTQKIHVTNALLSVFTITGTAESNVNIEHLRCDSIYIDRFKTKEFQFYDIKSRRLKGSRCQITNSHLGTAQFNKVHFNTYATVNFYRSYFEEVRFSGVQFPGKIESLQNIHYPDKKEDNYGEMQYELFRQLKVALVKNSNQVQALDMHKRMFNAIWKSKTLPNEDRIILALNKVSNDHETSVGRPLLGALVLLFVFWLLYCFFLPDRPFELGWYGFNEFLNGILVFLKFTGDNFKVLIILANPVHNMNNLADLLETKGTKLTTGNYVVSFFSRLFIAWMYYQFVSSFRKFGRKL